MSTGSLQAGWNSSTSETLMKIGIVGTGSVGCACAMAATLRGSAREIVLVNRTRKTAEAVATDIRYGTPLGHKLDIFDGDYGDLQGAEVVLITSGVNEKTGGATDRTDPRGRLRLLEKNAEIYRDIIPRIVNATPRAVLLVVTDPPDPLADVARETSLGATVLSAGTYLDSQRFRIHLGKHFGVDRRMSRPRSLATTEQRRYSSGRRRGWAVYR
jgi:L-lactate dehydrogenase